MALTHRWAVGDSTAARRWLEEHASGSVLEEAVQRIELVEVLDQLDPESDPAGALDALRDHLAPFRSYDEYAPHDLPAKIFKDWVKRDRGVAVAWLAENAEEDDQYLDNNLEASLPLLDDFDAAFSEVERLPSGSLRNSLEDRLTEKWLEERPDEALAWLKENQKMPIPADSRSASSLGLGDGGPFEALFDDPFAVDENPSDEALPAVRHNERMDRVFERALEMDMATAMEVAARSGDSKWIHLVVKERTLHDPVETVEWLSDIEAVDRTIREAWQIAMHSWTRESPEQVIDWVERQPVDALGRDPAIGQIIEDLTGPGSGRDYAAAIDWALQGSDEKSNDPVQASRLPEPSDSCIRDLEPVDAR